MQDKERICGFWVERFPQKPDYLPITQEEFEQRTLEAWCGSGNVDNRIAAVFHGGPWEWDVLCRDESISVRGAVACHSSERHQLLLVGDPEPVIRKRLAIYGTDKVRNALLDRGETDLDVLTKIAKYGSTTTRHRLVDAAWNNPEAIQKIARYLPASAIDKLLAHPNMEVRIDAASHGSRTQCLRALEMPYPSHNITLVFMRDRLIERLKDLDEVARALGRAPTKIRNMEMELST